MTLDKLIYDVRESLREYVDDSNVDNRYIQYLINNKRAKLLGQDLNRQNTIIDEGMKQTFCLNLQRVNALECGVDMGCKYVYRTERAIPEPMDLKNKPAITRVSSVNIIDKPFTMTNRERAVYQSQSAFNTIPAVFYHTDKYLYLIGDESALKLLKKINITGVFENPLELIDYTMESGEACYDVGSFDYPIAPRHIDIVIQEVTKQIAGSKMMPVDDTNNGKEDGNK